MSITLRDVVVERRGDDSIGKSYEKATLLDNGWLVVEVPSDNRGSFDEYLSPCEVESFYEA